jgi:hypothetical protein
LARPLFVIAPAGAGRVKRYRRAADIDVGGDRGGDGSVVPTPSLWDRDLWAETLFSPTEPESTAAEP